MKIRLMLLSAFEVAALAMALIYYLYRIVTSLEQIGGLGNSYLARIRFGVRAIEKETSHLTPEVTRLNGGLSTLAGQLGAVDEQLRATAEALSGGKERRR
jgi:hypothetical protein